MTQENLDIVVNFKSGAKSENPFREAARSAEETIKQTRLAEIEERKRERMIRKVIGGSRELLEVSTQLARGIGYLSAANEKDFQVMAKKIAQMEGWANTVLGAVNSMFQLNQLYGDAQKLIRMLTAAKLADTAATMANTRAVIANKAAQSVPDNLSALNDVKVNKAGRVIDAITGRFVKTSGGAVAAGASTAVRGGIGGMLGNLAPWGLRAAAGGLALGAGTLYGGYKIGERFQGMFWEDMANRDQSSAKANRLYENLYGKQASWTRRWGLGFGSEGTLGSRAIRARNALADDAYYNQFRAGAEAREYESRYDLIGARASRGIKNADVARLTALQHQRTAAAFNAAADMPGDSSSAALEASLKRRLDSLQQEKKFLEEIGQVENDIREKEIRGKQDLQRQLESQLERQKQLVETLSDKISSAEERFAGSSRADQNKAIRAANKLQAGETLNRREITALLPYADTLGGDLQQKFRDLNRQELINRGGGILTADARSRLATEQGKLAKIEGDLKMTVDEIKVKVEFDERMDEKFREAMSDATEDMITQVRDLMEQIEKIANDRNRNQGIMSELQKSSTQAGGY